MKRTVALFCILIAAGSVAARAQAVPAAYARTFSITVGGTGTVFEPDFIGDWNAVTTNGNTAFYPIAETSNQPLIGMGAYVDIHFTHWIQVEAEGRWLRFNQYNPTPQVPGAGINMDHYLIGPRVPLYQFRKARVYGKALVGFGKMGMGVSPASCTPTAKNSCLVSNYFTDVAFGGGVDIKLTKRISLRALDVEYQYWPQWYGSTVMPYGASVGIGYKFF